MLVGVERRLPLVNVTCLYRVGSANERPGITGIAHYVEHMAFRATEHVSHADVTGTIERIGGRWNGYTWIDQTLYAATVPSWALESILHIEAERMSRVLFDPQAFRRERTSVVAELQGYENDPASILRDLTVATSFEIHPYRYNVIGWLTDVLSIERDEALGFYRDFYGPNHAYLSIVGDVDPAQVHELVERHFAPLSRSRRSADVRVVEPAQEGEKTVALTCPGSVSHLHFAFRAPEATSADFPTLLVLDAVLAGGRGILFGSREARTGTPLADAVEKEGGFGASTDLTASRAPFVYEIALSTSTPARLDPLEKAVGELLERLGEEGPTDAQLERARRELRAEAAYETTTLAAKGHRLSYYEALGSWRRADEILQAIDEVTSQDVGRFAKTYLTRARRTVGKHVPGEIEKTTEATVPPVESEERAASPASPVPARALQPVDLAPFPTRRARLQNGTTLVAARREGASAVLGVRLGFGSALDPPGKEGLALLAGRMLLSGPELATALSRVGARSNTTAVDSPTAVSNREYVDLEIQYLPEYRDAVVEALARALRRRQWTDSELEAAKEGLLDEIAGLSTDAVWIAEKQALERTEPGWRAPTGSPESVRSITLEDLRSFVARVAVGGAITAAAVTPSPPEDSLTAFSPVFESFASGPPPKPIGRQSAPRPGSVRTVVEGKTQAEIVASLPAVGRTHPDALALRLLSYILGETGYAGRLGDRLVDTGLTYSVYAAPPSGKSAGPLTITTGTAPANLEHVTTVLREVLLDLSTQGITEAEWNECRAFRLGRLILDVDSPTDLAARLVEGDYLGRDLLDFPARSAEILTLSRERLNEVAHRYLRPDLLTVSVAGALPGSAGE